MGDLEYKYKNFNLIQLKFVSILLPHYRSGPKFMSLQKFQLDILLKFTEVNCPPLHMEALIYFNKFQLHIQLKFGLQIRA